MSKQQPPPLHGGIVAIKESKLVDDHFGGVRKSYAVDAIVAAPRAPDPPEFVIVHYKDIPMVFRMLGWGDTDPDDMTGRDTLAAYLLFEGFA